MENLKNIHLGSFIQKIVIERNAEASRICKFLNATKDEVENMYQSDTLTTDLVLRWCKLLKYDFFRIYSQHLILYSPVRKTGIPFEEMNKSGKIQFRKNIYTKEIIDFIIEVVSEKRMTIEQVVQEYGIPKTTVHRWLKKYK